MIRLAAILSATVVGVGVLATTSASVPAPVIAHVGVNRGQPVAGRTFTGFTVTPGDSRLERVNCDATLNGADINGHSRRFYTSARSGPLVAVTCGWSVPADARGTLVVSLMVESKDGFLEGGHAFRWRIKR